MASRDDSTYILVHDSIPDHQKIEKLSDGAFRLLIDCWCWCHRQRTDGVMPKTRWAKMGKPKTRAELLTEMAIDRGPDVEFHDYLDWQRSAAEANAARTRSSVAGTLGNHRRWHVKTGQVAEDCPYCESGGDRGSDQGADSVSRIGRDVG